jgi:hypothetical protein
MLAIGKVSRVRKPQHPSLISSLNRPRIAYQWPSSTLPLIGHLRTTAEVGQYLYMVSISGIVISGTAITDTHWLCTVNANDIRRYM